MNQSQIPDICNAPRSAFIATARAARSPSPIAQTMENTRAFSMVQGDWLLLAPYGDFEHQKGLQRVDRIAVDNMVEHFNSLLGRLGRLFTGVPFYIGHPDNGDQGGDTKAYGWIMKLG
jgi:hypothetical protein